MKFFHISDLHIGLKLLNRDFREDQEYILEQIVKLAEKEKPDAVVIAGDIYDKAVPAAESVEVFDHFLEALTAAIPEGTIMMISGNHDSAPRVNCFRGLLSRQKVYMIGMPPVRQEEKIEKVTLTDAEGAVNFYLLPFVKPSMVKQIVGVDENGNNLSYEEAIKRLLERESIDQAERNVLVSHQFYLSVGQNAESVERMDSELCTVGNIDQVSAAVLTPFDYAALGHIHKPMKVGSEVYRYCGTPLACSVSEAGQQKGVIMVELGRKHQDSGMEEDKELPGSSLQEDTWADREQTQADTEKNIQTEKEKEGNSREEKQGKCVSENAPWIRTTVLPLEPLRRVQIIKGTLEEVLAQGCQDYVTVVLTDKADRDVFDMKERLHLAFPYLLEIRRENVRKADYSRKAGDHRKQDPFSLCCSFLKDLSEEEKALLQDVINTVQ